ncbi:MAG TPA: glycosyltransferase family 4 protein [Phycisphaerae bacterium]|nr:glycosyltransferase family 4 protein [Phycisphaerae bacterium]
MKIGYVISRYPAVSHTFIQREVLGLRKLGWSVTTISVRRSPESQLLTDIDREESRRTHTLVRFAPFAILAAFIDAFLHHPFRFGRAFACCWKLRRPGARGMLYACFYFAEALLLHRICRRENIRHLHAHFANVASDVAMIASVLNRGTFSFTMHGPTEFFDLLHFRLSDKIRAARFVVCISDFARSQLMSILPPHQWSRLHVVRCGVELRQFQTERAPRNPGAAAEDATNILCVARLAPEKGHAILLQALAELSLRGHETFLTLIGDGPVREDLTRLAEVLDLQDRIRFLGNVGQSVIHQHYAAADLFVLPSFAEGVPVVLMEAMAARCPVISTRIAGISELIEHGASGLLVVPGRADLLADAMEQLLLNPRAAQRMASVALEKIRRDFNLEGIIPQLAHIFRRVLAPQTAPAAPIDARHRAMDRPVEESPSRSDALTALREEVDR